MSFPAFRPLPSLLDPSVIPKAKSHTPFAHGPAAGGEAQTQAQGGVQKVTLHEYPSELGGGDTVNEH